jgi:hypothetical protein
MKRRKLITRTGTDPEVFKIIEFTSHLETVGTPEPNKEQLKDMLAKLTTNSLDFPRLSTSAQILIELLNTGDVEPSKVLEKARSLIDKLKEDLGVPPFKKSV